MAQSTLNIEFTRDAVNNEYVFFTMFDLDGVAADVVIQETFKDGPRVALNTAETGISAPAIQPAGQTVINYDLALDLDYGTSRFTTFINPTISQITFTAVEGDIRWGFKDVTSNAPGLTNHLITNDSPNPISIVSEIINPGTCSDYNMQVETNIQIAEAIINGVSTPVTTNPFNLVLQRNINNYVVYKDASNNQLNSQVANPVYYGSLSVQNTTIDVVQDISGATVTTTVTNADFLVLEYKINTGAWQSSNVFSGLAEGTYTMHIRDQLGCEISTNFEVTAQGTRDPIAFISKANALNFVVIEDTDSCNIPVNDTNTFAYENLAELPDCTETLMQTCDKTTTQLKSNYETVEAVLIDEAGVETPITVEKKSANLNRFEAMDCTMYAYGNNQAGIYFTEGNLYDEAWFPTGDTYALNGNLPDFAVLGNVVSIQGLGTFEIKSVLFDDRNTVRKKVIVIDYNYTGNESAQKIACLYDLIPYEIYQFDIDWSGKQVGWWAVGIRMSDSDNGDLDFLSERINLAVEHKGTIRIDYYNTNNRDIFYKYGIEHRIRVPFISLQAVPNGEQEIQLTDDGSYVIDSMLYEADKIVFNYMVKSMMRKVSIALGCQYVFLNGVGYAGDGNIEFEAVGLTNLYDVSKTMVKTNISYNTRNTGSSGVSSDYVNFNIPSLIAQGKGMLKQ